VLPIKIALSEAANKKEANEIANEVARKQTNEVARKQTNEVANAIRKQKKDPCIIPMILKEALMFI
jgi:capsular polysaccharide biosynthesis protein